MKVCDFLKKLDLVLKLNNFNSIEKVQYSDGTEATPGKHVRLFGLGRGRFFEALLKDCELFTIEIKRKYPFDEFAVLRNHPEFKLSTLSKNLEINDAKAKQSLQLIQSKCKELAKIRDEAKSKYDNTSVELTTDEVKFSVTTFYSDDLLFSEEVVAPHIVLEFEIDGEDNKLFEVLEKYLESQNINFGVQANYEKMLTFISISEPAKNWEDPNSTLVQGLKDTIMTCITSPLNFN